MVLGETFLVLTLLLTQTEAATEYIRNASAFAAFAKKVTNSGIFYTGTTVYLTCDIDMKGKDFVTIGAFQLKYFEGSFNGNGHLIQNINTKAEDDVQHTGLFGYAYGGKISNIILDSTNTFENTYAGKFNLGYAGCATGSIVARCYNCIVENVASLATIVSSGKYSANMGGIRRIGGVVGHSYGTTPTIKNAAYAGTILFKGSGTSGTKIGDLSAF